MSERGLHIIEDDLSETWIEDWAAASGVIRHSDLAGGTHEGWFECSRGPGNEVVITVRDPIHMTGAEVAALRARRGVGRPRPGGELNDAR